MEKFALVVGCITCLALPSLAEKPNKHHHKAKGKGASHVRHKAKGNPSAVRRANPVTPNYGRSSTAPNNVYRPPITAQPYHWSVLDLNRNGVLESWELRQQGYSVNGNYTMNLYDLNRDGYIDSYEASRMNRSSAGAGLLNFLLQVAPHLIR